MRASSVRAGSPRMARDRSPGLRRQFRLPIDDGWLQVTEWGSREPDVTVVLTHGWSLSSSSWEDVAEMLVAADPAVRVLAYDHRGHGGSATGPASIEALADDLAAVLRALVPDGPIVFGGPPRGRSSARGSPRRHGSVEGAKQAPLPRPAGNPGRVVRLAAAASRHEPFHPAGSAKRSACGRVAGAVVVAAQPI